MKKAKIKTTLLSFMHIIYRLPEWTDLRDVKFRSVSSTTNTARMPVTLIGRNVSKNIATVNNKIM